MADENSTSFNVHFREKDPNPTYNTITSSADTVSHTTVVVAWITDISERALPETDFMRYARSRGGQVRSSG
jgi:hypothetical protein